MQKDMKKFGAISVQRRMHKILDLTYAVFSLELTGRGGDRGENLFLILSVIICMRNFIERNLLFFIYLLDQTGSVSTSSPCF